MEYTSREELKKDFTESLEPLLLDKIAQDDEEIVNFYMEVCCVITEEYCKSVKKQKLYPNWLNNLLHLLAGVTIGWLIFKFLI